MINLFRFGCFFKRGMLLLATVWLSLQSGPLIAKTSVSAPCDKLPGMDSVKSRKERFFLFGELHGTNEVPQIFSDLICSFGKKQELLVLLEMDQDQQRSLDSYMASARKTNDVANLLGNDHWKFGVDGRASAAMLRLIDRIAELKGAGFRISLRAFHPSFVESREVDAREAAIARSWQELTSRFPKSRVLVLTGLYHIGRLPSLGGSPAAMRIPTRDVISFRPLLQGGNAWSCQGTKCDVNEVEIIYEGRRGILSSSKAKMTDENTIDEVIYYYSTGSSYSASFPASPEAIEMAKKISG